MSDNGQAGRLTAGGAVAGAVAPEGLSASQALRGPAHSRHAQAGLRGRGARRVLGRTVAGREQREGEGDFLNLILSGGIVACEGVGRGVPAYVCVCVCARSHAHTRPPVPAPPMPLALTVRNQTLNCKSVLLSYSSHRDLYQ